LADLFRVRAFVVLYLAESQSIIGDQLARVALSILVFRRTNSAPLTALTYATTYLPAILGGLVLAGIDNRLPRRLIMIGCDLARAGLFAAVAIPGLLTGPMLGMVALAVFLAPAFAAAEVSYLAGVFPAELFRAANGLRMVTNQAAQVFGFAAGGVLVAALNPRGALLVDGCTYLLSALVIAVALGPESSRPAPLAPPAGGSTFGELCRDGRVRGLLALSALAGLFIVPEGLAVPFGSATGASTVEIGLLLASIPLGGAVGVIVLVRIVRPRHRPGVANWMAVGCGLPLAVTGVVEHWPPAVAGWFLSGFFAAYQVEVVTSLVQSVPDAMRLRLVGLGSSVLLGAQGAGLIAFGWVAHVTTPGRAIGLAGLVGSGLALVLALGPLRRPHGAQPGLREDSRTRSGGSTRPSNNSTYLARHRDVSNDSTLDDEASITHLS
jgi:hypothetical protein